jgi:hypothetical protein
VLFRFGVTKVGQENRALQAWGQYFFKKGSVERLWGCFSGTLIFALRPNEGCFTFAKHRAAVI